MLSPFVYRPYFLFLILRLLGADISLTYLRFSFHTKVSLNMGGSLIFLEQINLNPFRA